MKKFLSGYCRGPYTCIGAPKGYGKLTGLLEIARKRKLTSAETARFLLANGISVS